MTRRSRRSRVTALTMAHTAGAGPWFGSRQNGKARGCKISCSLFPRTRPGPAQSTSDAHAVTSVYFRAAKRRARRSGPRGTVLRRGPQAKNATREQCPLPAPASARRSGTSVDHLVEIHIACDFQPLRIVQCGSASPICPGRIGAMLLVLAGVPCGSAFEWRVQLVSGTECKYASPCSAGGEASPALASEERGRIRNVRG